MTKTTSAGDNRLPIVIAAVDAMANLEGAEGSARARAVDMADAGIVPADLKGGGTFRKDAIAAWTLGVVGKAGLAHIARQRKLGNSAANIVVARIKRAGGGELTARELTMRASSAIDKLAGYVRDALAGDKAPATRTSKPSVNTRCHNIANERDKLLKLTVTPNDQLTKADKELLAGVGSVKAAGEMVAALNMALALFSAPVRVAEGVIVPRTDNVPAVKRTSRRRKAS